MVVGVVGIKKCKKGLLLLSLLLILARSVVHRAGATEVEVETTAGGDDHRKTTMIRSTSTATSMPGTTQGGMSGVVDNNAGAVAGAAIPKNAVRRSLQAWAEDDGIIRDPLKALTAVEGDGSQLETVSDRLKADKEIVMAAVTQNGYALQYASDDLKVDKEIVLAAVSQVGGALKFVPKLLQNDKEIVLAAVSENKNSVYNKALYYASDTLKMDKEVVMAAVDTDYRAFFYASDELKNDIEFVLVIVGDHDGRALEFVSPDLKMNKAVVTAAVSNNCDALQYASDGMKADEDVIAVPCGTSSAAAGYFVSSMVSLVSVLCGAIVLIDFS